MTDERVAEYNNVEVGNVPFIDRVGLMDSHAGFVQVQGLQDELHAGGECSRVRESVMYSK